jgi:hypothetical protein
MNSIILYTIMESNEQNIKVKIKVSEIITKCRRKEDMINFARELGKIFIKFVRIVLSCPARI